MAPFYFIKYFKYFKKYVVLICLISFNSLAFAGSYEDFFKAIQHDEVKVVSSLLSRGFDPNTVNMTAEPAVLYALRSGSLKSFEALVKHPNVRLNVRNAHNESALMLVCLKGHVPLVKLLISRHADVNHPGWTPLHYAATGGHLEIMKVLLEESAYIDAESPNGTTPLMMAARYGSAKAVQLLIEEGADVKLQNQLGLNALDFARQGSRPDAIAILQKAMGVNNTEQPISQSAKP